MNAVDFFIAEGRLRPIWRFFLSVGLIILAFFVAAEVLGTIFLLSKTHPNFWAVAFWQSVATLAAILGAFKLMTAVFDGRPLASVGLAFHSRWGRELGLGLGLGAAMLFLATGFEWAFGSVHFTFTSHPLLHAGSMFFVGLAVAAANEEIAFRGYPFQRLMEAITPAGAVVATSALFGIIHLGNPNRTWISTLNTALVGATFAIAYLRTRALWMSMGMHFIWNFITGFFLGLPLSGYILPGSILNARVQGPVWLTGGKYGPEGGLAAMAGILLVTLYLLISKRIYTSEDMKALVLAPAKSRRAEPPLAIFSAPPRLGEEKD